MYSFRLNGTRIKQFDNQYSYSSEKTKTNDYTITPKTIIILISPIVFKALRQPHSPSSFNNETRSSLER